MKPEFTKRGPPFDYWYKYVEEHRAEAQAMVEKLKRYGFQVQEHVTREVGALPFVVALHLNCVGERDKKLATTTIRFVLLDHNCNSDIVITNITTYPVSRRRMGMGRSAVQALLRWGLDQGMKTARATQVQNEEFFKKIGFVRADEPNPCNDFVRDIPKDGVIR